MTPQLPVHKTPWRSHQIVVYIAKIVQRNTTANTEDNKVRNSPFHPPKPRSQYFLNGKNLAKDKQVLYFLNI